MDCTLDNYDLSRADSEESKITMAAALIACKAFVDYPVGWLYLYGPTGVGKSHLAAAVGRALAEQRACSVTYASEPALAAYLRDGWGESFNQDERVRALQDVEVLILDDLGTEHRGKNSWIDSQLFAILQPRYQHGKLTIITSNLHYDDLEARIRSRILGMTNPDYCGREQCILIENADQREEGRR